MTRFAFGIILTTLFNFSAVASPVDTNEGGRRFVFKTFADNLARNLNETVVGYAFTVSYKDEEVESRSGGRARVTVDGALPM